MDIRILLFIKTCKDLLCCFGERKNDRRSCSQQKLIYWRVICSQNIKEMFEESIDSVTKDLLRLKKKKIPANQRIIQPLFITSRHFVSLAKRSSSSGKRWACDISACWNRCVECLLVLWVSKALWNRHRKNTIFLLEKVPQLNRLS